MLVVLVCGTPMGPVKRLGGPVGVPADVTIKGFAIWLEDKGWASIKLTTVRRRLNRRGASFTVRGANPLGANAISTLNAPRDSGEIAYGT